MPDVVELYEGLQVLHPEARWQNQRGSNGHFFIEAATGLPIMIGRFHNTRGITHTLVSYPTNSTSMYHRGMLEQPGPNRPATYTEEDSEMYLMQGIGSTPDILDGPRQISRLAIGGLVRSTLHDAWLLSPIGRDRLWDVEGSESMHAIRDFGRTVGVMANLAIQQVDDTFLAECLEASSHFADS